MLGIGLKSAVLRGRWILMAALLWLATSPAGAGTDFPEFPQADFMDVTIVADEMIMNGVPMQLFEFSSSKPEDELASFYRREWDGRMTDTPFGDQRILAHRDGDYLLTVQMLDRNDVSVRGTLSIAPLFSPDIKPGKDLGAGFPLLPGSKVLNDIRSQDGGKASRTLMISNSRSIGENYDFYLRRLEQEGWRSPLGTPVQADSSARALMLNRGNEEMNIAFSRKGRETFTVVVTVKQ